MRKSEDSWEPLGPIVADETQSKWQSLLKILIVVTFHLDVRDRVYEFENEGVDT